MWTFTISFDHKSYLPRFLPISIFFAFWSFMLSFVTISFLFRELSLVIKVDLLATNSLSFPLFKNAYISSPLLKNIFRNPGIFLQISQLTILLFLEKKHITWKIYLLLPSRRWKICCHSNWYPPTSNAIFLSGWFQNMIIVFNFSKFNYHVFKHIFIWFTFF